jgi:hypothetical protein
MMVEPVVVPPDVDPPHANAATASPASNANLRPVMT